MKRIFKRKPMRFFLTALAACMGVSAVSAQMLQEIVVTAEKREASLHETSIAITAMGSDQLKDLHIISQQDVANFTPNMSYQESAGGGEGNRIYIRGIGRETASAGTDPGVGIYNNGFYTAESGVMSGSFDRIERIECLR